MNPESNLTDQVVIESIKGVITDNNHKYPNSTAILAPGRQILTYKNLSKFTQKIAFQLRSLGINRNERVAVALSNGAEMAVSFLAISSCATCAPLNPNYREAEYDFYLTDLNAKALIVQSGVAEAAKKVAITKNIPVIELKPDISASAGIFSLGDIATDSDLEIDWAQSDDIALVLHTSGTTSRPKIVPLTQKNLLTSANNIRTTLKLQFCDRCLNVMPLFHIHGLMGVLLSSMTAGASVVCTPGFYAPQFYNWIKECQPTWYSAVPTMHQGILARAEANRHIIANNPLRLIRSSSAPLPPQIIKELETTFNAPVIEAYGMTEASHQMASNPLPPQTRKPGSVGIAVGLELAIMDEGGNILPTETVGEVVIKGANVTLGYENNPEANAKSFTKGWFRTGDLGSLDTEGYLYLKGRIKEIINRGGEKISPREVDEVLLDHPAVEQVVTFAAPHTLLGEDVAAAIVLKANQSATELELKEFTATKLADYKVPRVILFLEEIPKGATGKRQRIGLANKLGLTATNPDVARAEYVAPRTGIEADLASIWAAVLDIERIGIHDNFFQLGGDSILAAQIVNRVRENMGVELSFLIFFQQPTLASMAIKITEAQAQNLESDSVEKMLAELETLSDAEAEILSEKI
ncbi:MAG: AMP-binding protein [Xenococcaceae cyanobacterium MO_207.B15]|nr:AMP-binding protein [Xenococcaceae cyanobacterium MO_207.B15]